MTDSILQDDYVKSFGFIDNMDLREIHMKLYGHEGGFNGTPLFLEEAKKERRIRLNKTMMLRAQFQ
jgi:hypothetical protein